jgi:hypothetical protein
VAPHEDQEDSRQKLVINSTTRILHLYIEPLAIVGINYTIVRVIEPQRYMVVLCNEILIERI